jgi:hypothetical protein
MAQTQLLRAEAGKELAWDLRTGCAEPAVRGALSALLWILGDPIHAQCVAAGASPSRIASEWLVERSLRQVESDPFVQQTWIALVDDFHLEASPLFHKLSASYETTPVHKIDRGSAPPVSRTFAQAAIGLFRDRLEQNRR